MLGGLAQPNATRKQVQHQAVQAGLRISVQGLDQRFNEAGVEFMRRLLEVGLTQVVSSADEQVLLPQFNGVYVTDCTRLVWGQVGLKMGVRLELQRGQLQACLTDLKQHDQKAEVVERPLPAGALHLGDLGFFKLKRFRQWSADGVYWLTRYKVGTRVYSLEGQALDLPSLLAGTTSVTRPVRLGSGKHAVNAWLVAASLPDEVYMQRMVRLREQARLDQRPLSARQQELAHWTIYLTNLEALTFEQAHILARTRWQIELVFKLWKSHGQVVRSRSADPLRQQCEGYAKLLGVLIAHWSLLVAGWQPHRIGMLDAFRILRSHVPHLQQAFREHTSLVPCFAALQRELACAPRLAKRRKHPLAFQLWERFEAVYA